MFVYFLSHHERLKDGRYSFKVLIRTSTVHKRIDKVSKKYF